MTRLERWTAWVIAEWPDPGQRQLLHRYAVWHVTRRLRPRLGGSHATHNQVGQPSGISRPLSRICGAVFLRSRVPSARPPRQWRPSGQPHAISTRSATSTIDPATTRTDSAATWKDG